MKMNIYWTFYAFLAPKKDKDSTKGLSGLTKLTLGLPLDKKEQFSDWERRPLRRSQLTYAGNHFNISLFTFF